MNELIGRICRKVEEAGVHYWACYPGKVTDGSTCLATKLVFLTEQKTFLQAFVILAKKELDKENVMDIFTERLKTCLWDIEELKKEEQVETMELPRKNSGCDWSLLLTREAME